MGKPLVRFCEGSGCNCDSVTGVPVLLEHNIQKDASLTFWNCDLHVKI